MLTKRTQKPHKTHANITSLRA